MQSKTLTTFSHGGVRVYALNYRRGDSQVMELRTQLREEPQGAALETVIDEVERDTFGPAKPRSPHYTGVESITCFGQFMVVDYYAEMDGKDAGLWHVFRHYEPFQFGSVVLPLLEDGRMMLISQNRHAPHEVMLEPPGGARKANESFEDCALRQLREETGVVRGATSDLVHLGTHYPNGANQTHHLQIFALLDCLATEKASDKNEPITGVHLVSPPRFGDFLKEHPNFKRSALLDQTLLLAIEKGYVVPWFDTM